MPALPVRAAPLLAVIVALAVLAPAAGAMTAEVDTAGGPRPAGIAIDVRIVVTVPCDEALANAVPDEGGRMVGTITAASEQPAGVSVDLPATTRLEAQACLVPSVQDVVTTLRAFVAFGTDLPGLADATVRFNVALAPAGTGSGATAQDDFTFQAEPILLLEARWQSPTVALGDQASATNELTVTNRGNVRVQVRIASQQPAGLLLAHEGEVGVAPGASAATTARLERRDGEAGQSTATFLIQAAANDGTLGAPITSQFLVTRDKAAREESAPGLGAVAPLAALGLALATLPRSRRGA